MNPRATASHVLNAEKPITSRTGVNRAAKARVTLATAQAIFVANGQTGGAQACQVVIDKLNDRITEYYRTYNPH